MRPCGARSIGLLSGGVLLLILRRQMLHVHVCRKALAAKKSPTAALQAIGSQSMAGWQSTAIT